MKKLTIIALLISIILFTSIIVYALTIDDFIEVVSNTDECLINCEAIVKIKNPTNFNIPIPSQAIWNFTLNNYSQFKPYELFIQNITNVSVDVLNTTIICNPYNDPNSTLIANCTIDGRNYKINKTVSKWDPFTIWGKTLGAHENWTLKITMQRIKAIIGHQSLKWFILFSGNELDPWFNTSFNKKNNINFPTIDGKRDITNAQFRITINTTNNFNYADFNISANGTPNDIRIVNASEDGELACFTERWNTSESSHVWFNTSSYTGAFNVFAYYNSSLAQEKCWRCRDVFNWCDTADIGANESMTKDNHNLSDYGYSIQGTGGPGNISYVNISQVNKAAERNFVINISKENTTGVGVTAYVLPVDSSLSMADFWFYDFNSTLDNCRIDFCTNWSTGSTPNTCETNSIIFGFGVRNELGNNQMYQIYRENDFSANIKVRSPGWHNIHYEASNNTISATNINKTFYVFLDGVLNYTGNFRTSNNISRLRFVIGNASEFNSWCRAMFDSIKFGNSTMTFNSSITYTVSQTIPNTTLIYNNTIPLTPFYGSMVNVSAVFNHNTTRMLYVNFSLISPNGTTIFNNLNGTVNNTILSNNISNWTSRGFVIRNGFKDIGTWLWNWTALDNETNTINSSNGSFVITDTVFPNVTITDPKKILNNRTPSLNFIANDTVELSSCWYNVTDRISGVIEIALTSVSCGVNITLPSLTNDKRYVLWMLINDTSNNRNMSNSTFDMLQVRLSSNGTIPTSPIYTNNVTINAIFNHTNDDLKYVNFSAVMPNGTIRFNNVNGSLAKTITTNNLTNWSSTYFVIDIGQGNIGQWMWNWTALVNDSTTVINSGNGSFVITDTTIPNATIYTPTGTVTTLTPDFNFSALDNVELKVCHYNITKPATGVLEVGNTSLSCTSNITLPSLTNDLTYDITLVVWDKNNNENQTNMTFTVSAVGGVGGGGDVGGGGTTLCYTLNTTCENNVQCCSGVCGANKKCVISSCGDEVCSEGENPFNCNKDCSLGKSISAGTLFKQSWFITTIFGLAIVSGLVLAIPKKKDKKRR